ncbi:MAG: CorA family divalent cation transporter [Actinomycetes bacterium]
MDVRFLTSTGVETCSVEALRSLLDRDDGFVWVDVPTFDEEADRVLSTAFGFHEMALRLCHERNHLPATHAYPDAIFSILHAPEPGTPGHVHLLELDQFVGRRFLVTVRGPLNPVVPLERALEETRGVLSRLEHGRLRPQSPAELSFAIVSALARRQRAVSVPSSRPSRSRSLPWSSV